MNSLPKTIGADAVPLLLAEGGVVYAPVLRRDPIEAFIELMEVVEALCPVWPCHDLRIGTDYRL